MIGNRRLGIGSGAEASSFSFTHPASTSQIYTFRIATSTGYFVIVDSAGRKIPTTMPSAYSTYTNTLPIPTPPVVAAYTSYTTNGNGATSCTVFSTDAAGNKSGTITQLDFDYTGATLLAAGALDISKCAKSLTYIDIGGQTNISSVTGLSSCTALTELRVNGCGFQSLDCTPLTQLLTVLANDQSSLTAFTANAKLKSLTIFNCPSLPTTQFALAPANATLEFLDCSRCPSLSNLRFSDIAGGIKLTALKVLDVSNNGQQSNLAFWPIYSKDTVESIIAQNLSYISSLSLNSAVAWSKLTTLNLSGSILQNDPWRIPTTVSALNLQGILFGETGSAPIGIDLTGCTLLKNFAEVFGDMSTAISTATTGTTMTTSAVRELILDGSGFTSINIQQTGVLTKYPLLKLSAQGMPNLTSFTLANPAWLKTILITNNPKLTSISITGATNRTLVDISVTISGNSVLTTRTLTGGWLTYRLLPTVTSVTPKFGVNGGAITMTITGTLFTSPASVTVGGVAATNVAVVNATSIVATAPAGPDGAQTIIVTTPNGTSTSTAVSYNNQGIPTFTAFSPRTGPGAGGTTVTFTGTGFLSVNSIKVNNSVAFTNIIIDSDTQIRAVSPARGALSQLVVYSLFIASPSGEKSLRYSVTPVGWMYS